MTDYKTAIRIQTFQELRNFISGIEEKGTFYFRGYQNENELISKLGRARCNGLESLRAFGKVIIKHHTLTFGDLLALGQHYGVPTNLVDFTIDPWIAVFFGRGKDWSKTFKIIYANKDQFDIEHGNKFRPFNVKLDTLTDLRLQDIVNLTIDQFCKIDTETPLSPAYLDSPIFSKYYSEFFRVQDDYVLYHSIDFIKNKRLKNQNGLFIVPKTPSTKICVSWFQQAYICLEDDEFEKLNIYFEENKYKDKVFPKDSDELDLMTLANACIVNML